MNQINYEDQYGLPPANGLAKIIQINHRNGSGDLVITGFARFDSGIIFACVEGASTKFGIANMEQLSFVDGDFAMNYVKTRIKDYLGRQDVDFLVREGDPIVHQQQPMPQRRM